jgi:hypothetical protein
MYYKKNKMGSFVITNSTVGKNGPDVRIEPWMTGGSSGGKKIRVDSGGVRLVIRH